jgi:hypothetical protein
MLASGSDVCCSMVHEHSWGLVTALGAGSAAMVWFCFSRPWVDGSGATSSMNHMEALWQMAIMHKHNEPIVLNSVF